MKMPFSTEDFLDVFGRYNTDVWPIQVLFYFLALTSVAMLFIHNPRKDQIINGILSFFWLWMGIVYHIIYFSPINPAAIGFGVLFLIQGTLFAYQGMSPNPPRYRPEKTIYSVIGFTFVFYALVVYPLLSEMFGHRYPNTPTFGLPCPTTIFTFGMFLFSTGGIRWYILMVPFLWSLIGISAAINLSIKQDYFLGLAGIVSIFLLLARRKAPGKATDASFIHR